MKKALVQTLIKAIYPPQCVMCETRTSQDFALCGQCWSQTPFITGLVCDACGCPLPGEDTQGADILCDDCLTIARPWDRGRAALGYRDLGRKFVLSLKHGDRVELARVAAPWMQRAATPFWSEDVVLVSVPLHWTRLLQRKYNQAGLLAMRLAEHSQVDFYPEALLRTRRTSPLDGHSREARFAALSGTIEPHPKEGQVLAGRKVVIVDDVMTSGASFAACAEACRQAGAAQVFVLALARVVKDA